MLKIFFALLIITLSYHANAMKTYMVNTKISLNNEVVTDNALSVSDKSPGMIEQIDDFGDGYTVEMNLAEDKCDAKEGCTKINYKVYQVEGFEKRLLAEPKFIVVNNSPASAEMKLDKEKTHFKLSTLVKNN